MGWGLRTKLVAAMAVLPDDLMAFLRACHGD